LELVQIPRCLVEHVWLDASQDRVDVLRVGGLLVEEAGGDSYDLKLQRLEGLLGRGLFLGDEKLLRGHGKHCGGVVVGEVYDVVVRVGGDLAEVGKVEAEGVHDGLALVRAGDDEIVVQHSLDADGVTLKKGPCARTKIRKILSASRDESYKTRTRTANKPPCRTCRRRPCSQSCRRFSFC
jgi:hypothetical protein